MFKNKENFMLSTLSGSSFDKLRHVGTLGLISHMDMDGVELLPWTKLVCSSVLRLPVGPMGQSISVTGTLLEKQNLEPQHRTKSF